MDFSAPLQIKQALRMLGFSESEVRILLVLFKEKKANTADISKQTAIGFSTAQYLLKNLAKRKIVKASGENSDIFETLSKNELIEWINEHKKINESLYEGAKADLGSFLDNIKEDSWKPEVLYFEGKEGIKQIYKDVTDIGQDVYSWLDIGKIIPILDDYLETYIQHRKEKNMFSHAIMPNTTINKERPHADENREVRYAKKFPIDGEIRVYGNNVAVIAFDGEKPVGFVFRGEVITRLFKAIFDSMWKTL